jgi:hypothetical protein
MRAVRFAFLLSLFTFVQCSSSPSTPPAPAPPTQALWIAPASLDDLKDDHWYDHPWPSDLRRDGDGTVRFTGFYNPHLIPLLDQYLTDSKGLLKGFSPTALGFMRFTGDIDPSTLPATAQASADSSSSVQILDIDPNSPEHGTRKPAQTYWRKDDGVYWFKDTLAVGPALGYPLRANTKYAIVATNKLLTSDGKPMPPSDDLRAVLDLAPVTAKTQAAHDLYAPAVKELGALGVAASSIAHLAVFTTGDPTAEAFAVAKEVRENFTAPLTRDGSWKATDTTGDYDVYEGMYGPTPNYQQGKIPFTAHGDGGNFVFDANGRPVLQGQYDLRFALAVPNATKCPAPATGYPVTLYSHGTGGDYRSFINDGTAQAITQQCVAIMGIDQLFQGIRPGSPPADDPNRDNDIDLTFVNIQNPIAMRANGAEAAADITQQARLFTVSKITVPASVSHTGAAIGFDGSKLTFFGHSEGGKAGELYLAVDNQTRGGVLSGSGASIVIACLEKTKPTPSLAMVVRTLLQLTHEEDAGELVPQHPVMQILQSLGDSGDPYVYATFTTHPKNGWAPKSVYQTEGIASDGTGDSYAPPHGIEIAAVAKGLPRQLPGVHPVVESTVADVTIPAGGLSGNVANGQATGILAQFVPPPNVDGHFVVFSVPEARLQAARFVRSLADDPKGKLTPIN